MLIKIDQIDNQFSNFICGVLIVHDLLWFDPFAALSGINTAVLLRKPNAP